MAVPAVLAVEGRLIEREPDQWDDLKEFLGVKASLRRIDDANGTSNESRVLSALDDTPPGKGIVLCCSTSLLHTSRRLGCITYACTPEQGDAVGDGGALTITSLRHAPAALGRREGACVVGLAMSRKRMRDLVRAGTFHFVPKGGLCFSPIEDISDIVQAGVRRRKSFSWITMPASNGLNSTKSAGNFGRSA